MRVLLVTKTLAEFSIEEGKALEISKLVGHLSVLTPVSWRGSSSEIEKLRPQGYELLARDCWLSGSDAMQFRYHLHFYPGISKVIGDEKWDLVHVDEEPFNLATYLVLRACRKHRRRAVFTTWQNLMKRYPPPFSFFEKYVYKNAAGALAGNLEALDILRRRRFLKPAVCVPQHGIDPSMFHEVDASDMRRKMGLAGSFIVGFVGRISHAKGLDTLLRALTHLPDNCVLVFVGTGSDLPKLRMLSRQLGLSARVRWEHWVDHGEIIRYMCAFDVLVLPSRTIPSGKEQFGRVLVEAMACETCVIGSDSGDIPNVVGDAGLIFHEGNVQDLASCLRRLMENPSLRGTLRKRGRERVLRHFIYSKIARDTVRFYRQICTGGDEGISPDALGGTQMKDPLETISAIPEKHIRTI